MCGIFGVLEHEAHSSPDKHLLEASARLLEHRGPDHWGVVCDRGIGLAHTRLALLDLSPRSNQPFWDASHRYCLVYNGEIYNFKELRAGLERKGVHFRTTSDTEVLLESILDAGLQATLSVLEGMFAFALYDKKDRSLALARDRFGIKPLYVYEDANSFMFSSEIRAMLPWRKFELDPMMAAGYLMDQFAFTRGFTLLQGVKMADPGSFIEVTQGEKARCRRFFSLGDLWDQQQQEELKKLPSRAIVDKVEATLMAAVEMQQVADAPVGALCSGGVDSSLTAAMASRHQSDLQIFHSNTPGKESELEFAMAIARHLKLELHSVDLNDQDHLDLIPETILHRGSPFIDHPTSIPFLKLSRLVREHGVKGVITGEASDECFWGYPHMAPNITEFFRRLPRRSCRVAARSLKRMLGRKSPARGDVRKDLVPSLFSRFEFDLEADEITRNIRARADESVKPRDFQSLYEFNLNLRTLLNRNDALGMAASVESRFPFLDYELVKLAINLPRRHKVRLDLRALDPRHPFVIDKWVLRRVADRYMPRELSRRFKVPWPTSAHQRFVIPRSFFENSFIADLFGFSNRELDYLMKRAEYDLKLKLLHLEVWAQMFLNGLSSAEMVQQLHGCISVTPQARAPHAS